jgi:hypothetical protein
VPNEANAPEDMSEKAFARARTNSRYEPTDARPIAARARPTSQV